MQENQLKDVTQEWESKLGIQNTEIKQDNLKTQIVSAITDLEGDRDLADFGKKNKTIDLMSPPQAKSPTPKNPTFTPTKQVSSGIGYTYKSTCIFTCLLSNMLLLKKYSSICL